MVNKRSGLVAEQRVDRNGNTVTRWVKPSTGSPASVNVPAPALNATPEPQIDFAQLYKDMVGGVTITHGSNAASTFKKVQHALMSYPRDLLVKLSESELRNDTDFWSMVRDKVQDATGADELSEYIHFLPDLIDPRNASISGRFIQALHSYEGLPSSADYSKESDEVQSQCSALLKVANSAWVHLGMTTLRYDDEGRFLLKDPDLVELLLEHHDKADHIVEAIWQRSNADPQMLREILSSESSALVNGVL